MVLTSILTQHQKEIIEGCIISDACLDRQSVNSNSRFRLTSINYEFIEDLKKNLYTDLQGHVSIRPAHTYTYSTGKTHSAKESYTYSTRNHEYLTSIYDKWYVDKKKIIPRDLEITPTMLRYWIFGDGSVHVQKKYTNTISFRLHTNDFLYEDVQFLQDKLKEKGFEFAAYKRKYSQPDKGYVMYLNKSKQVIELLKYVGDPIACFSYKWRVLNNA